MTTLLRKATVTAMTTSMFVLSACGGGGSSSSATSSTTTVTSTTSTTGVTSTNAKSVAATAYTATNGLNSQATSASAYSSALGSAPTGQASPALLTNSVGLVYQALNAAQQQNPAAGAAVLQTTLQASQCSGGGSLTTTVQLANATKLSSGDSVSIVANSCVLNGVTMNGAFVFTVNSLTSYTNQQAWNGSITLAYTKFSVLNASGYGSQVDGNMTVAWAQTNASSSSAQISGSTLSFTSISKLGTTSNTLSNYAFATAITSTQYDYSANYAVATRSPTLGTGSFTVTTTKDFVGVPGAFPSQGGLKVVASDGSYLVLTVLDATNVQISTYAAGGTTPISTTTTTWTDLAANA
ncbi:hypothetical protein [Andreprevotia chitinilytica]|uniref:hypothetical protein n=1 Tax=Andreprevotia chitinilytica TaxID=396808 RepID=UPI0005514780|nr:hypothetical protein [Andreprevotia chitinilytica]